MTRRKDDGVAVSCVDDKARSAYIFASRAASHDSRCQNSSVLSCRPGRATVVPIVCKDIRTNPGYVGILGLKDQRTEHEERKKRSYPRPFGYAMPIRSVTPMGVVNRVSLLIP